MGNLSCLHQAPLKSAGPTPASGPMSKEHVKGACQSRKAMGFWITSVRLAEVDPSENTTVIRDLGLFSEQSFHKVAYKFNVFFQILSETWVQHKWLSWHYSHSSWQQSTWKSCEYAETWSQLPADCNCWNKGSEWETNQLTAKSENPHLLHIHTQA